MSVIRSLVIAFFAAAAVLIPTAVASADTSPASVAGVSDFPWH